MARSRLQMPHFVFPGRDTENKKDKLMFKLSILVMSLAVLFFGLPSALSQVSSDWLNRYGPPAAESYVIRDGIVMMVFYSEEGRTCKADIRAAKAQPPASVEEVLTEIVPLSDRGKELISIGLTSGPFAAITSTFYERVRISLVHSGEKTANGETTDLIVSATIYWQGVQCKLPEQHNQK
jgi:hypothetical protein